MRLIQSGPRNAKIVVVGEAPGSNEEREGVPFIGGSGQILNEMLASIGVVRDQVFVTNIAHKQPPKNEFKWFLTKAGQVHLTLGLFQLKKDLEEIKPNLVVCMGGQPLRMIAGKGPITSWRGSIVPSTLVPGLKVISTIHPAAALRIHENKALIRMDFNRIKEEMRSPEIVYPERTFYLPGQKVVRRVGTGWDTKDEAYAIDELVLKLLKAPELSIDIECSQDDYGHWHLSCVGFSSDPSWALVLSSNDLSRIALLCATPSLKIFQNGMFDYSVLKTNGIQCNGPIWDTMVAHQTLLAESAGGDDEMRKLQGKKSQAVFKKGLGFQCTMYTREPYYKDDGKVWKDIGDIVMFHRYNALDVSVTREIKSVQEKELAALGMLDPFLKMMPLIKPIMRATEKGLLIDMEVREKMRTDTQTKIDNIQKTINTVAGRSINVKSPAQIATFLYEDLKLPPQYKKRANGQRTVTGDKDALTALGHLSSNPVLHMILLARQERDMMERYLNALIDPDGRMRCSFDMTGTKSFRLSSRASISGSGTNLQNQPEYIRQMYIADPGYAFVYRDYSQAEARVVAYQAHCRGLIELFEDPSRDIHTENAARIFGHSEARLEKYGGPVTAVQRYLAKRVVHACNYGMEAKRLVEIVNEDAPTTGIRITLSQAKNLIDRYFMLYPEIKEVFWSNVEQQVKHRRMLSQPFGFKRWFYARMDYKLLLEAYSFTPQSTVGLMGRFAWTFIQDELDQRPHLDALTMLNVHDSILVQCLDTPEAIAETVAVMREKMTIPVTVDGQTFTIPTDCKVGYNWGNASEDNPRGLKEYDE